MPSQGVRAGPAAPRGLRTGCRTTASCIDAALVRGGEAALSRTEERLVEMTNGCICCTLRDDLLEEVDRLAREDRFDHLLIESSGISEPMPVAATFAFARDDGATLGDVARLDTMVTVVDAANFLPELDSGDELAERGLAPFEDDERTVSDLLVDQIEFADVLVLNKLDLVDAEAAARLRAALVRLNPAARILEAEHVPETEEYGVSSTVFRSELPFHPGRLWAFVTEQLDSGAYGRILRSKGFFTLAGRAHVTGLWSQAGSVARFEPSAARDAEAPYAQELVFIGTGLERDALRHALASCLLAPGEDRPLVDPFPAWQTYGVDDTCDHEPDGAHAHAAVS
ncbi:GTP-binding protein [Streptomyces sviceus]|uniref:GTP-binding protein n=1 Tax=Streptomyces sviceus TaxID=285530 RepID=UPI0036E01046